MLSSLTPVGERARSQRWGVTVVAFTIGASLGGMSTGLAAGIVGSILAPDPVVGVWIVALGTASTLVGDLAGATPPSLRRQVDRTWMTRYRGWVYGLGYGFQLGTGLVTYISSWTTWLMVVVMVVVGDARAAVAMGLAHGLVRAASVWTTARLTTPAAIRTHHRLLHRLDPGIMWACRGALVLVVVSSAIALDAT